jgi:hypothetical protein
MKAISQHVIMIRQTVEAYNSFCISGPEAFPSLIYLNIIISINLANYYLTFALLLLCFLCINFIIFCLSYFYYLAFA